MQVIKPSMTSKISLTYPSPFLVMRTFNMSMNCRASAIYHIPAQNTGVTTVNKRDKDLSLLPFNAGG